MSVDYIILLYQYLYHDFAKCIVIMSENKHLFLVNTQ